MSVVRFACVHCGAKIVMGSKFWGKKVKCKQCNTILEVPDSTSESQVQEPGASKIGIIAIACGVLIVAGMLTWLFFLRDTWEQNHKADILDLIAIGDQQYEKGQTSDAIAAYQKAIAEVDQHKIVNTDLIQAIDHSRQQINILRTKQQVEAEETKRLAELEMKNVLEQHRNLMQAAATEVSLLKERYYKDGQGNLMSETERENRLSEVRNTIKSMPEGDKKAYLEGLLRTVEDEFARIKSQGPVQP